MNMTTETITSTFIWTGELKPLAGFLIEGPTPLWFSVRRIEFPNDRYMVIAKVITNIPVPVFQFS